MRIILNTTALLWAVTAVSAAKGTYAPYYTDCPPCLQLVRQPKNLSESESAWVSGRKRVVANAISSYLTRLKLPGFEVPKYVAKMHQDLDSNVPVLAWATSGGGWRSAGTGMGGLRAIDEATPAAVHAKTGGLFQSLTYLAGLSGGSWPAASNAVNDYPSIDEQIAQWHVNIDRFSADTYSKYAAPSEAYFETIAEKVAAGFNVSVSDYLGRAFAYEIAYSDVNATWSSIANLPRFRNFSGPLPMLLATSVNTSSYTEDGLYYPTINSTIYEWTPFDFGSWDIGFIPTRFVGTVPNEKGTAERCVVNLDQVSFVLGTVASAWNAWWLAGISNGTLGQFSKRSNLEKRQSFTGISTLELVNEAFNKTWGYSLSQIVNPSIPNPFGGKENITFADGAEGDQAIPFWGLVQPERKVDLIFAWDDAGDGLPYNWNNGTNIRDTYNACKSSGLPFPKIPSVSTMLARNYTSKPVLFGCNASLTTTGDSTSPIVAYFANSPYSYYTNYSWSKVNMSYTEFNGITENSFNLLTQANGSLSDDWVNCLGCAAVDRSLIRVGMARPKVCEECFARHCWDGTESELPAGYVFDPALAMEPGLGFAKWNETHPF